MSQPKGRNLALSLPRRFICDLLHFARRVPTVPVQRRMNVAAVVAARAASAPRPSWAAIFTKAYGFVCAARPELAAASSRSPSRTSTSTRPASPRWPWSAAAATRTPSSSAT